MTQIFLNSKDVLLHVYDECKYTSDANAAHKLIGYGFFNLIRA